MEEFLPSTSLEVSSSKSISRMCIALLVVSLLNPLVPCLLFGGWVQLCFLPRVAWLISAEVLMFLRRAAAVAFGLLFR